MLAITSSLRVYIAGNRVFAVSLYRWQSRLRCEFMSLAIESSLRVYVAGNEADTSERLFLINPTMDGTASAASVLRGDGQELYDLVGDHVSVLPVQHGVTLGSLRRATWSPTNLCYAGYAPHEGWQDASHTSAIVGLMRNNLSEVYASLSAYYTPCEDFVACA